MRCVETKETMMEPMLAMVLGFAAGAATAWLYLLRQCAAAFERGRTSLDAERAALGERLVAREGEVERLASDLRNSARAVEIRDRLVADLRSELAGLTAKLDAERASAAEKLGVLNEAREQLTASFRALSGESLKANNQMFLDLAAQTLGTFQQRAQGELERRQQAIHELVTPVKLSLDKLDSQVHALERQREGAYQALTTQVRSLADGQGDLRRETSNLVKALRQPAARGRWGELQLRRVVELAGMVEHCDFVEQASVEVEDGRLRPDLVVRLPGGANIVVDAKTPLSACLDAFETDDDALRRQHLAAHARQVREHATKLGRKSYQEQFQPSPDLVVLFLPVEAYFSMALNEDPALIEFGMREKVLIATPTTLIALLRAAACGWKQEALARNAREISELGRQLHERIAVMAEHWSRVGRSLGDAVGAYNRAVGSLESRVLVSARRFRELEAVPDEREIELIEPVESLPRALQMPELEGAAA
jgi:DNA recombination protein RmuC